MKNNKTLYVNSSTARVLADYLITKGIESDRLNTTLGFQSENLEIADSRLDILAYNKLWKLAVEFTETPHLGLKLAQNPYNDQMGLVAHIFFNSPTLFDGLKQYERYYSLVNESMHIEIETKDDLAYIKYICDYPEYYNASDIEHSLAMSVLRVKDNIVEPLDLYKVYFQHEKLNQDDSHYEEIFPCPIEFNHKYSALVFKKDYLNYKLVKGSTYLFKILSKHIESLYKKFKPSSSFTDQVSEILQKHLSVDCVDAEHIANKLHMSRHTLYRKLKSEGIAFHELVDKIREERAYKYLDGGKHSLSDIAFLLGFSELSAFSRAFKRWTGMSPAKYQRSKNDN